MNLSQARHIIFILSDCWTVVHEWMQDVFNERSKQYKTLKDDEVMLAKKREVKVRMELSHKLDKISEASHEITEVYSCFFYICNQICILVK